MPPKGTINLGFVKAIHSGVNPPLNKKMIWYDENEFAHKVWDVVTETWDYFRIYPEQLNSKADRNSSNLTEEDILSWREKLELFTKTESLEKFMQLQEFTYDGKIRADKIEALGLTEIILTNEVGISAFISNYASYEFQKNDVIAVLNSQGTYDLYIYIGYDKSSAANYLATGLSNITIGMVQGLQAALDSKFDVEKLAPLYPDYIPFLHGSGYFFNSLLYVDTTNYYFVGLNKTNPTEYLDVNGNIKSNSYKFTLPSVLTPQPNMLIAKTDGSGLMWYDNNSVGAEIPSYSSPTSGYVARWDGTKFVNGSIRDNGSKVGIGGAPSATSPLKVYDSNQIFLEIPHSTNPIPTNVGYGQFFTAYGRLYARQSGQYEYGNDGGNANGYGNSADLLKVFGLVPDMIFGNVPLNLNTIHTSNRAKYGASMLFCDGPYYGGLVSAQQPTAVGYHPDMMAGWTFSMIPTSQAGVQFRIDGNGQLYARGTGGQYHAVTPWKKYIGEVQNTTTTLNEKINATKGAITKDLSFTLQTSISPTPNTLVPKTDGSRPLWIDNNSVQHEVSFLEDAFDSLVHTHIHTLNKELYFSSFDYTLGRAVCTQPHNLTIGATYTAIIYVPNNWYEDGSVALTTFQNLLKTIPFELSGSAGVRIYVVDSTTIEFRNSSNVPIVINPTSTENNTFIDFTKWHLEVDNYSGSTLKINFTNVPKGVFNFAINIQGLVNTGSAGLVTYYVHAQDGSVVGNEISTTRLNARDSVGFPGLVAGRNFHHFNFYFESSVRNIFNTTFSEGYCIARNTGADNFGSVTLGRTMTNIRLRPACQNNLGLAGLQIHYPIFPNGTKIQIFRK